MDTAWIAALTGIVGIGLGFWGNNFLATRNLKKEISLKVAEYRLQWINNLGDQFAGFLAHALRLIDMESVGANRLQDHAANVYQEVVRSRARIMLLMNRQDENYKDLLAVMQQLQDIRLDALYETKVADVANLRERFIEITNEILKREWQRTKRHLREDTVEVSALKSESDPPWGSGLPQL